MNQAELLEKMEWHAREFLNDSSAPMLQHGWCEADRVALAQILTRAYSLGRKAGIEEGMEQACGVLECEAEHRPEPTRQRLLEGVALIRRDAALGPSIRALLKDEGSP